MNDWGLILHYCLPLIHVSGMLSKHTKKDLTRIKGLQVINDCAKCGAAFISQYNEVLTKNEEQRQYLLNIVQQHREKFKSAKKSLLIQMNTD